MTVICFILPSTENELCCELSAVNAVIRGHTISSLVFILLVILDVVISDCSHNYEELPLAMLTSKTDLRSVVDLRHLRRDPSLAANKPILSQEHSRRGSQEVEVAVTAVKSCRH